MRGMKNKQIAWVGLALVLLLVLMGAGCQRRTVGNEANNTATNNTVSNTVNNTTDNTLSNSLPTNTIPDSGLPDPLSVLLTLKQETLDATTRVKSLVVCGKAKTDLYLTIVSSKFINTLADKGLDTNWYIYTSPGDPNYYLVNMPRGGSPSGQAPKRIIMPQTDFNFDFAVLPIPMEQWKISYVEALQKAESLGGAKFRTDHKTFEVSVILAYPASGLQQQLSWSVTYKATDQTGAVLKVQINAATGDGVVIQ